MLTYLDANLEESMTTALSSARIGGSILLAVVGNAVLVPVVLFYLLLDWPNLMQRFAALVPPRLRDSANGFAAECDSVLGHSPRFMRSISSGTWRREARMSAQVISAGAIGDACVPALTTIPCSVHAATSM